MPVVHCEVRTILIEVECILKRGIMISSVQLSNLKSQITDRYSLLLWFHPLSDFPSPFLVYFYH